MVELFLLVLAGVWQGVLVSVVAATITAIAKALGSHLLNLGRERWNSRKDKEESPNNSEFQDKE